MTEGRMKEKCSNDDCRKKEDDRQRYWREDFLKRHGHGRYKHLLDNQKPFPCLYFKARVVSMKNAVVIGPEMQVFQTKIIM